MTYMQISLAYDNVEEIEECISRGDLIRSKIKLVHVCVWTLLLLTFLPSLFQTRRSTATTVQSCWPRKCRKWIRKSQTCGHRCCRRWSRRTVTCERSRSCWWVVTIITSPFQTLKSYGQCSHNTVIVDSGIIRKEACESDLCIRNIQPSVC